jgi:hypothetical protein
MSSPPPEQYETTLLQYVPACLPAHSTYTVHTTTCSHSDPHPDPDGLLSFRLTDGGGVSSRSGTCANKSVPDTPGQAGRNRMGYTYGAELTNTIVSDLSSLNRVLV